MYMHIANYNPATCRGSTIPIDAFVKVPATWASMKRGPNADQMTGRDCSLQYDHEFSLQYLLALKVSKPTSQRIKLQSSFFPKPFFNFHPFFQPPLEAQTATAGSAAAAAAALDQSRGQHVALGSTSAWQQQPPAARTRDCGGSDRGGRRA